MSTPSQTDHTDLAILNALQDDLPLVTRPWKAIADRLGITETEILIRMKKLEKAGIIRGISPCLNPAPWACMQRRWWPSTYRKNGLTRSRP